METTFTHIEDQLRTLPAFSWQGWVQGATYLQNNNFKLDVALQWAARALQMDRSVQTAGLHGKLLVLNGKKEEGINEAAEMRKEWSGDWRSHYSAAEIYEAAEEPGKAEESYKEAMALAKDDRTKQVLQSRIDGIE